MNRLADPAGSLRRSAVLLLLGLIMSCSSAQPHQGKDWTQVPVTHIGMVMGVWEGVVTKNGAALPEGSVRLIIRENGSYLFAGQNLRTASVGAGSLQVRDGRLIGTTDRRAATLSLYDHKGTAILAVEATNLETGDRYQGDFVKAP